MVFFIFRRWCFTFLGFACLRSKTLRILPTHSYCTSYAACWKSAPAHVFPDIASFCPHSPHRHVMRSLVATLVSMPMLAAETADPACHVARSVSECLIKPDPRIRASLSLVMLQFGPAKPNWRSGRNHRLFPPDARCADAVKATWTKTGCHAGYSWHQFTLKSGPPVQKWHGCPFPPNLRKF